MTTKKRTGFEGGLWIIPLLMFIGGVIFFVLAWKSAHSGSTQQMPDGSTVETTVNVAIYKLGYFWFSVVLFVAMAATILGMRRER